MKFRSDDDFEWTISTALWGSGSIRAKMYGSGFHAMSSLGVKWAKRRRTVTSHWGFPNYDGWPSWNIMTHQQMHTDWLYRAYQGGLRLIVALAVNNEALCISESELGPNLINLPIILAGLGPSAQELATKCNDDDAVTRQTTDLRGMESSLNNQCAANPALGPPQCPLPGVGWLHIVTTSTEARETINRGQLAVVLGVEVDRLFNCTATTTGNGRTMTRGPCSQSDVAAGLDKYQHLGIRHYFNML